MPSTCTAQGYREADRARPVDTEIWDQPGNDDPIYNGPSSARTRWHRGILEASTVTASSTTYLT